MAYGQISSIKSILLMGKFILIKYVIQNIRNSNVNLYYYYSKIVYINVEQLGT